MIDHVEVNSRVLRKRKIPQDVYVEEPDDIGSKHEYNVLSEHSYFRAAGKKSCRWPGTKHASKISDETLLVNNIDYSDDCPSIPDYLEGFRLSSDEDDDKEVESLASLLRAEYENDIKAKKLKVIRPSNLIPLSTTLQKLHPGALGVVKSNESSKKFPRINLVYGNNFHKRSASSLRTVGDSTTNFKNPEKIIQIVSSWSTSSISPKNQNINELKTVALSDSLNNIIEKSNVKNIFTCDDLLSNDSVNEKNKKDSVEEPQNDLLNSPMCTDKVTENNESTHNNLRCPYESPIVNNVSLLPENVSPPFEWFHIIYLAMKHSTYEYVTSQEIQNFSRRWFPFYCKKSWIRIIWTTLNCFNEKYFVNYTISIASDDAWTVKKKSVNYLEMKMMSVVKQFENAIKSSMRNPDQLPLLLKGYGVHNLGYNNK